MRRRMPGGSSQWQDPDGVQAHRRCTGDRASRAPLRWLGAVLATGLLATSAPGQAIVRVDTAFHPQVANPAYARGQGPRVLIDEAHYNLNSLLGFDASFGELLRVDGYQVASLTARISAAALTGADVVVISDALPAATEEEADTLGSAFTDAELHALLQWIQDGGALLLFVDHRPYPRAAAELGKQLGLEMLDGYALDYETWEPLVFSRARGTLGSHPITSGGNTGERVDSVATFDGHAMRATQPGIVPLMIFGPEIESMQPKGLWEINDATAKIPIGGWLQGAALRFGEGRVVVYGEAGMAVAQRVGPRGRPRGMNAPMASQNARLLLNTMHWLTDLLPGQ